MQAKHCLLDVEVTVKYQSGNQSTFAIQLTLVEEDDVLGLIEREVLDYVNLIGTGKDYKTFTLNTMKLTKINREVTCYGCRTDQPNQQAHAQYPGDCLYTPSPN